MMNSKKLQTSALLAITGIIPIILLYSLSYFFNYYTLIGPFCSTAALVINNPRSEFCHIKNIIGGYFITVSLVILFSNFLDDHNIFVFLFIFAASIFLMNFFNLFHPSAAAITIVEFFVTNNPYAMISYTLISVILMCFFTVIYRELHKKYIT